MARFSPVIYVTFSRQRSLVAPIARADSAGRYRPPTSRAPIALAGRHLDSLAVIRILPRPLVLALVALALATACHRGAPAVTRVAPLQLFGAEPDLMPALGFEPVAGVLTVSAQHPVFVTVVEVDPATQARDVVFPETGATPLRVSGEMSLQLALQLCRKFGVCMAVADECGKAPHFGRHSFVFTHRPDPLRLFWQSYTILELVKRLSVLQPAIKRIFLCAAEAHPQLASAPQYVVNRLRPFLVDQISQLGFA